MKEIPATKILPRSLIANNANNTAVETIAMTDTNGTTFNNVTYLNLT